MTEDEMVGWHHCCGFWPSFLYSGTPFPLTSLLPLQREACFFYFLAAQVALPPAAWLEAKQRPPLILGCLTYGRLSDLSEPQVLHL